MDPAVSEALLSKRWPRARAVLADNDQDPDQDLWRDGLTAHARILARANADGSRDPYVFQFTFVDYDEQGPTIQLCDPNPPHRLGATPFEFYPLLEGNNTFGHANFFCMQGDRRAYEVGGHNEWRQTRFYHPEEVISHLVGLLNCPAYKGRRS